MCQHLHKEYSSPDRNGYATETCLICGIVLNNHYPARDFLFSDWSRDRIRKPVKAEPRPMMPSLQPYFQDRMR